MQYTLKVGDLIAQKQGKITGIYKVSRLTRTTAIILIYDNEVRFKNPVNPEYFRRIGADTWSRESFKLATAADVSEFKTLSMRRRLSETNWATVDDETIKIIIQALENDQKTGN